MPRPETSGSLERRRRAPRALTTDGGYRSADFLPNGSTVLALRGNAIVRLGLPRGTAPPVQMKVAAAKLVGVDSANPWRSSCCSRRPGCGFAAGHRVAPERHGDRAAVRRR